MPQIGGNCNEAICAISPELVAKSGVPWVRAFVNIPRNYLKFNDLAPLEPPSSAAVPPTGVLSANISQPADTDSWIAGSAAAPRSFEILGETYRDASIALRT